MTNLSRRAFAFGLPAASVAATYVLSANDDVQAGTAKAVTPLAQIKIGRFTVTALADGFADMPFSYFPGRTPEEVEAAAKAVSAAKPGGIRFMFNQYLVDDGERLILVDTGPAGTLGTSGRLPDALQSIGVRVDSIGAVTSPTCIRTTWAASSPAAAGTFLMPRSTSTGATSPTGPIPRKGRWHRTS